VTFVLEHGIINIGGKKMKRVIFLGLGVGCFMSANIFGESIGTYVSFLIGWLFFSLYDHYIDKAYVKKEKN
jgi:hypothetical protein